MAALGRGETDWKEEIRAAVLFGTEFFVRKMPNPRQIVGEPGEAGWRDLGEAPKPGMRKLQM